MATTDERKQAILGLLGLARRAGALQLGSGPVLRALDEHRAGVVFLARDAGGDVARKVRRGAEGHTVDDELFDAGQLAAAFGRQKLSVVSVHEPGFVSGLEGHMNDQRG